MLVNNYCAIYDFGLFPCALGNVLIWNVLSAIRCEELGRERVDAYIWLDEHHRSNIFQQDLITADNCALLFNELFSALGTNPRLGNIFVYRRRDDMLDCLRKSSRGDPANEAVLDEYERVLVSREREPSLAKQYCASHASSHERINTFAAKHERIPLLRPSPGCEPDVAGLIAKRFAGKRIVAVHVRQNDLDAGIVGKNAGRRNPDFREWYEFLKEAQTTCPDVLFVALGRVQETPQELLGLSNLVSLRTLGLGLGHELSLILRSDLFMGTPGGFAVMAYFSTVPYFITKLNPADDDAYKISPSSERLPFATERQVLVYEPETRELLKNLLDRGLQGVAPRNSSAEPQIDPRIDVRSWEWERSQWLHPGATTSRYLTDASYSDKETAYLAWPSVVKARTASREGLKDAAWMMLQRIENRFPRMCGKYPEFLRLKKNLAIERNDQDTSGKCHASLRYLSLQEKGFAAYISSLKRHWHWGYPWKIRANRVWAQIRFVWERKHRIPGKLVQVSLRLMQRRSAT